MSSIIKWAGGKTKIQNIIGDLLKNIPHKRFIDLFCGSLAIPLHIQPELLVINDINNVLIQLYMYIKKKSTCNKLLLQLKIYNADKYNNKEMYNELRGEYNILKQNKKISIKCCALFIYLNKRCYNGLYRENSNGKFNVPYRHYNTDIYNKEHIYNFSDFLNKTNTKLYSKSYNDFDINFFKKDDIVYIDPPYYPSKKSQFTQYWSTEFKVKQQQDLALFCTELDKKGVKFIVSNSPCEEIRDLYKNYNQHSFYIGRQMRDGKGNSQVYTEKEHNEIIIWNFEKFHFEE